ALAQALPRARGDEGHRLDEEPPIDTGRASLAAFGEEIGDDRFDRSTVRCREVGGAVGHARGGVAELGQGGRRVAPSGELIDEGAARLGADATRQLADVEAALREPLGEVLRRRAELLAFGTTL